MVGRVAAGALVRPRGWAALLLLIFLFLAGTTGAWAESTEEIFNRGNQAYEEGRYAEAAEAYRSLLKYSIRDPRLEYNLANAEFRLGNLGQAILHYERARRLDPTDTDIRANLELARSMGVDLVEGSPEPGLIRWLHRVQERLGPDRQAWIVLALVWAVAALVAACSARPAGWRALHGWILAGLLLVTALGALSWQQTFQRLAGDRHAVVLAETAEVLAGPGENNPALFTVHEGLTLEVQTVREEWVQVSLPNSFNGWISRQALELI